jgi:hypothetical protein
MMQFVLVIYHGTAPLPGSAEWESRSKEEQQEAYADYAALNKMENLTPGPPLGLPQNATTVRAENGSTVTTQGPWLGLTKAVGGFYVVEAEDLDAAVAIASRVPQARRGGAVEVRPSAKYW